MAREESVNIAEKGEERRTAQKKVEDLNHYTVAQPVWQETLD